MDLDEAFGLVGEFGPQQKKLAAFLVLLQVGAEDEGGLAAPSLSSVLLVERIRGGEGEEYVAAVVKATIGSGWSPSSSGGWRGRKCGPLLCGP